MQRHADCNWPHSVSASAGLWRLIPTPIKCSLEVGGGEMTKVAWSIPAAPGSSSHRRTLTAASSWGYTFCDRVPSHSSDLVGPNRSRVNSGF